MEGRNTISLLDLKNRLNGSKPIRNGTFTASCPAHRDRKPSLSVSEKDGKLLLKCHAGCSFEEICSALGVEPAELFTDRKGSKTAKAIEAIYSYRADTGELAYQIVRYSGKRFVYRRPGTDGDWVYNRTGVPTILYKTPELKAERDSPTKSRRPVFICEGEKDVETLSEKGVLATCNPFGAGKWRSEYNASLAGLDCVIIPDNDDPGLNHAEEVARSIGTVAASVSIVKLPDLPDKGDVTDWFENGGTVEKLNELVRNAEAEAADIGRPNATSGLMLTSMADFLIEPATKIQYVWDDTLPASGFGITSAKPKDGKSTLLRNLALAVARGEPFLGRGTTKGAVLYLCLEEIRDQIRAAFAKMGATDERIYVCTSVRPDSFQQDLRSAIHDHDISLVIGDPLSRVVRERDFNDYAKMSHALEASIDLARKLNVHLHFAHHDNKSGEGSAALLGSTALFGAVDTLLQITSNNGARTLKSRNRYGVDIEPTILEFDPVTRSLSVDKTERELKASRLQDRVFEFVYREQPVSTQKIKKMAKGSMGDVSKALSALREAGKLMRTGTGFKGEPFIYSVDPKVIDF